MHTQKQEHSSLPADVDEIAGVTDAEFAVLNETLDAELTDEQLDAAVESSDRELKHPDAGCALATRTRHTTIRIPADVLNAFRAEASRRGIAYQTLIIQKLRIAADFK
jgi:predicted DNA binding CopG/RHH family protein